MKTAAAELIAERLTPTEETAARDELASELRLDVLALLGAMLLLAILLGAILLFGMLEFEKLEIARLLIFLELVLEKEAEALELGARLLITLACAELFTIKELKLDLLIPAELLGDEVLAREALAILAGKTITLLAACDDGSAKELWAETPCDAEAC